eukprot:scaffold291993_cov24-Tisochrysis_lutea.AAC.2
MSGGRNASTKGSKPPRIARAMPSRARQDSLTSEDRSSVICRKEGAGIPGRACFEAVEPRGRRVRRA